jgi:hypothetical protein
MTEMLDRAEIDAPFEDARPATTCSRRSRAVRPRTSTAEFDALSRRRGRGVRAAAAVPGDATMPR